MATRLSEPECERLIKSPGHGVRGGVCASSGRNLTEGLAGAGSLLGAYTCPLLTLSQPPSGGTGHWLATRTGAQRHLPDVTLWGLERRWSVPRVWLCHGWLDHRLPGTWARVPVLGSGLGFSLCAVGGGPPLCGYWEGRVGVSSVLMLTQLLRVTSPSFPPPPSPPSPLPCPQAPATTRPVSESPNVAILDAPG